MNRFNNIVIGYLTIIRKFVRYAMSEWTLNLGWFNFHLYSISFSTPSRSPVFLPTSDDATWCFFWHVMGCRSARWRQSVHTHHCGSGPVFGIAAWLRTEIFSIRQGSLLRTICFSSIRCSLIHGCNTQRDVTQQLLHPVRMNTNRWRQRKAHLSACFDWKA